MILTNLIYKIMEKITIHYNVDQNGLVQRKSKLNFQELDVFYKVMNICPLIIQIISCTDMARLKVCEYYVIWYKNNKKARLTISKSTL